MERLERNLWRYLWFSAALHTPVFVPVVVLFWTERGLDLGDVFLLQAAYAVAVVLLEVPTGMLADRWGKRTSLIAAAAMYAFGFLFYGFGEGFGWFLVSEVWLAVASALYSGADSALLYDTLVALDRRQEFARWEGRGRALQMAMFSVANVVGGLVATVSLPATLWLSAVGPAVALIAAFRLVEARPPEAATSWADGWRRYRRLVVDASRFVVRHQRVRFHLTVLAVLLGSSTWLLWLYQPYLTATGVPVWSFGLVFASFNLFAAAVSSRSHELTRSLGERASLAAFAGLQIGSLVLMASVLQPWSFVFVFGQQTVRAWARPVLTGWVLEHTWEDKRSTVLSLGSMWARLFFACTAPGMAWAVDALSLPRALALQAVVLAVVAVALAVVATRIPGKYERVKPEKRQQA